MATQCLEGGGGPAFDVMLQGDPFCDLTFTFTDRDALPAVGQEVFARNFAINAGGSFNISASLSRLGLRVGLKAQLGSDIFSRFILERMVECGLSRELVTQIDEPKPIITVGISFPHDRLFISYERPDRELPPWPRLTFEELEGYHPRALFTHGGEGIEVFRAARARGILVFLDTHWNVEHLHSDYLREVLAEVDVAAPNLAEALEITGATDAECALERLSELCGCVAIKLGAQGCIASCHGERFSVPGIPVQAIETTGAGDNFNAGLIYGLLRGYPFDTALRCANITGGLSTLIPGGCQGGYTADDVERMLANYHIDQEEAAIQ